MQKIIQNKKRVMMQIKIIKFKVPYWPELGVDVNWEKFKKIPGFVDYIPDEWHPKHHRLERGFVWGIVLALAEEWAIAFVRDIRQQKALEKERKIAKPEYFEIHPVWAKAMLGQTFHSCKFIFVHFHSIQLPKRSEETCSPNEKSLLQKSQNPKFLSRGSRAMCKSMIGLNQMLARGESKALPSSNSKSTRRTCMSSLTG